MEENQPKTGKFSLNYGLILGAISVIFGIMLYSMDAHTSQDPSNTVISIVIMVAVIIWGIISFRKANGGFLTLGEALKLGAGIALVAAIIAVLYTVLMANVIDPDFALKIAENQKAAGEAAGTMSAEQLQQQYDGTINYFWISYPFILIFNIIAGLIIGLIGGLILKKAKPDY
ncbi:DUF4199 domain-containing protein [uncultured Eudoraea sp.]|uniref:DUF4199 domain-containing protein n=1 Tax=uncultured Eudoraea sp. TaxID=1035614 RepID=UPI00260E4542|nr:DUF4199 domain-containing protein [uncultured Eudoraea sp.]